MSEQDSFYQTLAANRGKIYTPDRKWVPVKKPMPKVYDGDIWCDPKEVMELPKYEMRITRTIESIVAAGHCGSSGNARFGFVYSHVTDRANGDLFDWNRIYIEREIVPKFPEHEFYFCDFFGEAPRRTMNRLKERVEYPREKLLQDRMFYRMAVLSLAVKCFLARAGYPEYCERRVY